ncbi:hypothetical protein QJS66_20265 [Kocuria rhizophila]|nr:hypothetical protein QJS66_20265 [Kocuria rhizophila]
MTSPPCSAPWAPRVTTDRPRRPGERPDARVPQPAGAPGRARGAVRAGRITASRNTG